MPEPFQAHSAPSPLAGLSGSLVPLATPFRGNQIDDDAFAAQVERQIAGGTSGLVVCGSTGEASALTPAEYEQLVHIAVSVAAGRVPVIAGCTSATTEISVTLAESAMHAGADALLCAPPPYCKPTQQGIALHIGAVAKAAPLPIILYDVPSRVGVAITDATVAHLFDSGMIAGIKDATADLSRPPRLRALCGKHLRQFSGDDATQLAYRAMGGHGCISVAANIAPALCARLHRAWHEGDLGTTALLRDELAPLHAALFAESNPIPLKAALAELGLCEAATRAPLTPAEPATVERLQQLLPEVMVLEKRYGPSQPYSAVNFHHHRLAPNHASAAFIM
jgi:4-hydroxy-tetrahydrodipicolinate synthase